RLAAIRANAEDVKLNIEKTMLEIKRTDLEITLKEQAIAKERERIGLALSLLYKEGNKTDLEILFSNDSLSEYINQLEYLKDINSSIKDSLIKLKIASERLAQDKKELEVKKLSLLSLEEDLLNKQDILTGEMDSRELVLDQTKASESEYQRLLNQVKREQDLASADVVYLEKTIRDKLAKSKKLDALNDSVTAFVWPVPSKIITTYFHDPDYPYRNLFEHPALDIKAKQSTPIKAAAAGYVGRVKSDGSTSYAYIMIVHGDDLATVYGHISKALVKEGQYINQGDTIALSGGAPNQTGSGPLTTGPHLHFEVRLRGIPVNPLSYLQ
ncbi:MAG TPA: peptidoglycan DD-metalloendopeptidase family protein, partial [bacterium]|nr:peptidoglycan DD-metalloendopeptidase family protein [bacterium]